MLLLVGLNHRSAPLSVRERAAFAEQDLPAALGRLLATPPVREAMILSTCNRVELLVRSNDGISAPAAVRGFLESDRKLSAEEIRLHLYEYAGSEAVRHLFQVASGLDSMVLGEPQILGQVKRAYQVASDAGTTGPVLDHLLQQCLSAAKRVRTDTAISRNAVSIAFAAVELARTIFGELTGRSVLLLGSGEMDELAARHLSGNGVTSITVSSRTYTHAADLSGRLGGRAVSWDRFPEILEKVDIVVAGTAAPDTVLGKAQVQRAMRARRSRPLFLIDIAVPRDVEPEVNTLDNVYLYDIDDLQGVVDANLEERVRAAEEARRMVDAEVESYERWRHSLEVTPTIVALREALLAVGEREIERFRRRLGPMSSDQEHAVEELTRSVIQKILHSPIRHLKASAADGQGGGIARLVQEMFGLTIRPDGEPGSGDPGGAAPRERAREA